jgi:acyl-CoA synthetase (AMP-forming)/AMP-acid ligase II
VLILLLNDARLASFKSKSTITLTSGNSRVKKDTPITMPLPLPPLSDEALPKVNAPFLPDMQEDMQPCTRLKSTLPLADFYANQILGTPAQTTETTTHPWLRKAALITLALAALWGGSYFVYTERTQANNDDATLSFDPSRMSGDTALNTHSERSLAPLSDAEEETSLQNIPKRRVMVVTEGEREQLLRDLKVPDLHQSDTETVDTYVLTPPPSE